MTEKRKQAKKGEMTLLPCPFCGGMPVRITVGDGKGGAIRCENLECKVKPSSNADKNIFTSARWWNKRGVS